MLVMWRRGQEMSVRLRTESRRDLVLRQSENAEITGYRLRATGSCCDVVYKIGGL